MDLGGFCQFANLECSPAGLTAFNSPGSFWHTLLGAGAAMLPGAWPVAGLSAFAGYEFSKVEGGKSFGQIAGAFLEFALGLALGSILIYMGER